MGYFMISRVIFAMVLICVGVVHAQDVVVVGKGSEGKLSFSVVSLQQDGSSEARAMVDMVRQDLVRSGWFSEVSSGAAIEIAGKASGGASLSLQVDAHHTATGRRYPLRSYTGKKENAALVAHRAADYLIEAITGKPGMAASRIVMVGARENGKDLYVCHPDGSGMMQITRDGKPCIAPSWSPDGNSIIYTSLFTQYADVLRIDLRSAKRTVLVNYPGMNAGAVYSTDGQSLALTLSKDGNPELYVRTLRNGALMRLTTTRLAAEASPSWSPDGRQIVYVSDKSRSPQLYTIPSQGGVSRILTLRGSENVSPDWGRSGIVFATKIQGRYGICVIDPETRREIWRYSEPGIDLENPCWAPDGRHIACVRTQRYHSQVYLLDTGGDAPLPLTTMQGEWYSPAWSAQ
jgi:TolB protein